GRRGARSSSAPEERRNASGEKGSGCPGSDAPHRGSIAGRHDRVRRQAVDLGLVEQQEHRAGAADAVVGVLAVEAGLRDAPLVELFDPVRRALAQLVEFAELDGLSRAGLGAGRLHPVVKSVVAQRALVRRAIEGAPVDDAVWAAGDAVAAAVADVLLHDDGAELGAEQRAGGTDIQAAGVRTVLAHVRRHQPSEIGAGLRARAVTRALKRGYAEILGPPRDDRWGGAEFGVAALGRNQPAGENLGRRGAGRGPGRQPGELGALTVERDLDRLRDGRGS